MGLLDERSQEGWIRTAQVQTRHVGHRLTENYKLARSSVCHNAMNKNTRECISDVGVFGPADFRYRKCWRCGGVPACEPCRRDFAMFPVSGIDAYSLTNLQN